MTKLAGLRRNSSSVQLIALQFFSLAGVGIVSPYVNVYLSDIEFSGVLIGTLASLGATLTLIITPVFTLIADRRLLHRRLLMLYLTGFALANFIFASTHAQLLVIIAVLLIKVTVSPSLTLGMQLTMALLIQSKKAILGKVRAFASLGFALASLTAGTLIAAGGYPLLYAVGVIFALVSIQMATVFPDKPKGKVQADPAPKQPRNRGFYVLALCQFFVTIGTYNSYSFLYIHLRDYLGVNTMDIGIWAAILAALEIPSLYLLDAVLPKLRIRIVYIVSILGIALFTFSLGLVPNLTVLALLLVFRGIVWPCFHLSSFRLVNAISHPRNAATNQAILQVTMPSTALLLTGSLFGWTYDNLGSNAFFAFCSLACLAGMFIVIAGFRLFDVRNCVERT